MTAKQSTLRPLAVIAIALVVPCVAIAGTRHVGETPQDLDQQRLTPVVMLASGSGWSFQTWVSTKGVCYEFDTGLGDPPDAGPPDSGVPICALPVVGAPAAPGARAQVTRRLVCSFEPDTTVPVQRHRLDFECVTSRNVVRVVVKMKSGSTFAFQRFAAPASLKVGVAFFLGREVAAPFLYRRVGGGIAFPFTTIDAYDRSGHVVDSQQD